MAVNSPTAVVSEKLAPYDSHIEAASTGLKVDFGGESTLPPPPELTVEEEKRLWRKIDLKLMPILTVVYLMSFIDRGG
jgi:hypothetical protein